MKLFIVILSLLFIPFALFAQIKVVKHEMNRKDLENKIFDEQLYNSNFVQVTEKYYYPNMGNVLGRVAAYNSIMKIIDTNYIVKVKFLFKDEKHIENIIFTLFGKEINIIEFKDINTQNGLAIMRRGGWYTYKASPNYHFSLSSGFFHNTKPYGCHLSYNPVDDSTCLIQTYYDSTGNVINTINHKSCNW